MAASAEPIELSCPSCHKLLRIADPTSRGGPCPFCSEHISLQPRRRLHERRKSALPVRRQPISFEPELDESPAESAPHVARRRPEGLPRPERMHPDQPVKVARLRFEDEGNLGLGRLFWEFMKSQSGRAVLACAFLIAVVVAVFSFFQWDAKRRIGSSLQETPAAWEESSWRPAGSQIIDASHESARSPIPPATNENDQDASLQGVSPAPK